ncbi:MAG: hypothetical protein KJP21_02790 [Bacteroidia bacterium]|nr:hypothetical protein [Bacteroidia bacterium]NNJ54693.1 hypothetical protein [Bacteroidia bacterium]
MIKRLITYQFRNLAVIAAMLFVVISAVGQTVQKLPLHIRNDLTLDAGVYTVTGTHYLSKEATLSIKPGVTLIFEKDATIRIDGGIKAIGEANNLINVTSTDKTRPGNGFVINGVRPNQDVEFKLVRFNYIKKPISFEFRWSRNSVKLTKNVIKNSLYEGAAIEVKDIDNLLTEKLIPFEFKDNTFCNSTSSILISNITSDLLTIDFDNNVITRNEYTGRSRNGIFTSPVYMTYNHYQRNDVPTLTENSIFDNFYSLYYEDTFDIGRTNLSVIGNADMMDLSGNYFGNPEKREIEETFDFISANFQAPFLYFDSTLTLPPSYLNGHFYEVLVNSEELDERMIFSAYNGEINTVEMRYNRPVIDGEDFGVFYHFISGDSIKSIRIKHTLKWTEGNQYLKISLNEKLKKYGLEGYLEVNGLYDSDGMDVPTLYLGKKGLLDPEFRGFVPQGYIAYASPYDLPKRNPNDTIVAYNPNSKTLLDTSLFNGSMLSLIKGYYDYGVFIGNSIYFGDLNKTVVSVNPRNMRPNGGLRFGYQATEKLRFGFRNSYMLIAGSDQPKGNNSSNIRGTTFERDLSFRTTIIDASVLVEYNLLKFKQSSSFVPSVFAGGNMFYFKPMAQVDGEGKWYDLRSIGTEGQTINGANNQYRKVMYGIPFGASIKRHISQFTIVSLSYTYNKTFTDYLDDVSTGYYPDPQDLMDANPVLGPTAVKLSNPGNQPERRSYSDDNDGYGYWGLTFTYKIR